MTWKLKRDSLGEEGEQQKDDCSQWEQGIRYTHRGATLNMAILCISKSPFWKRDSRRYKMLSPRITEKKCILSKPLSVLIIDTMNHNMNADIPHNPLTSRAAGMALQNYVTPVWELHPNFWICTFFSSLSAVLGSHSADCIWIVLNDRDPILNRTASWMYLSQASYFWYWMLPYFGRMVKPVIIELGHHGELSVPAGSFTLQTHTVLTQL